MRERDIDKIAKTLEIAISRYERLGMVNTVGLNATDAAWLNVNYDKALRDVIVCQRDFKTAIEYYART